MISRGGTYFTLPIDVFEGWIPFYTICWWYPGVEPPLLCQLMLSRGGPLLLCTKLIVLRGGPSFTMSIDGFKGWIPFYTICWWYPGVEPPFLCTLVDDFQGWNLLYSANWCFWGVDPLLHYMLMISRGGTSFIISVDAFKGWTPFAMYLSWLF